MSLLKHLLKELSPQQEDILQSSGFEIIEHIALNDYDLVLLYHPSFYGDDLQYTVGFQRKGRNFIDPFDQHQKEEIDDVNFKDLIKIPNILKQWVNQYGTLVIGSHNEKKTQLYVRVFERYEFTIIRRNIMGINAILLS